MASDSIASVTHQLVSSGVPFKCPSDADWVTYSSSYNIRLPFTPAVVVLPRAVWQVTNALAFARKHGLKVQARSGGHSYASHSIGGMDGAMVVDMRSFQFTHYIGDPILVETGVRLGNLAKAIYSELGQNRALPHGTCAGVGLGGHLTHGGFGLFSRAWGLAMDHIVGMTVITADGNCIFADQDQNGDLFYAMRGAGDSFGIVKSFYLDTVPAPESVIHWEVNISGVTHNVRSATDAFKQIQRFTRNEFVVDRQLGLQISLGWNHFNVQGTYLGPRKTLENTIIPAMLSQISERGTINIDEHDWPSSLKSFNQGREIETDPSKVYQERANFFAKSVVVPEPGFTVKAINAFFTYLLNEGSHAPVGYFILIDLYGGADSQIKAKDIDFSAFAHRDALWVIQINGFVGNEEVFPPAGIDFINGLANSFTMHLKKYGAYSNYTDPTLTREQAHKMYYGDQLSKILWKLKKKWDPNNLFDNPQSIFAD
ncbi:putative glucooligosaccharide oxidase [Annulohypoxylon bovei var. microspora]|nr:putative glucooligosaccharide oxidase [Annulohypoxylon bovei var. microspora]